MAQKQVFKVTVSVGNADYPLVITSRAEPEKNMFSAESDVFGAAAIGVGTDHRQATLDLVDHVQSIISYHCATGRHNDLVDRYFKGKVERHESRIKPDPFRPPATTAVNGHDVRLTA